MKSAISLIILLVGSGCVAENKDTWIAPLVENSTAWKNAQSIGARTGSRIIWYIEGEHADFNEIYIGEDVGGHTNRIATLRVRKNGKTETQAYDTKGEELWILE